MSTFTTWKFNGTQFLAAPANGKDVHIMDENGNNYGAWMDVERFRKRQQDDTAESWSSLGKARIQIVQDR